MKTWIVPMPDRWKPGECIGCDKIDECSEDDEYCPLASAKPAVEITVENDINKILEAHYNKPVTLYAVESVKRVSEKDL